MFTVGEITGDNIHKAKEPSIHLPKANKPEPANSPKAGKPAPEHRSPPPDIYGVNVGEAAGDDVRCHETECDHQLEAGKETTSGKIRDQRSEINF